MALCANGGSFLSAALLLALFSLCARFATAESSERSAKLLQACWDEAFDPAPRSFMDWLGGRPPCFHLSGVWWSPRNSSVPLTIVTTATYDRLPMLEAQCRDYAGPLVAAVYMPVLTVRHGRRGGGGSNNTGGTDDWATRHLRGAMQQRQRQPWRQQRQLLQGQQPQQATTANASESLQTPGKFAVRAALQTLFERMEAGAGVDPSGRSCCCQLRLLFFTERVADTALAAIMPTNAMRNAAMTAVETPLAAMVDVDLGLSGTFNAFVTNKTRADKMVSEAMASPVPKMFIPPAWEANYTLDMQAASRVAEAALRGSKAEVLELWRNNSLQVFQADVCPGCHAPFKHGRWAVETQQYGVQFQLWFEPWGALWRFHDPGYDERFRGWYFNKVSYVETLARLWHVEFIVLPDSWLVHRPHPKIAAAELHHGQGANSSSNSSSSKSDNAMSALKQKKRLGNAAEFSMYEHYMSYIMSLRTLVRELLAKGQGYMPTLNPQVVHCRRVLPWWNEQPRPGNWRR